MAAATGDMSDIQKYHISTGLITVLQLSFTRSKGNCLGSHTSVIMAVRGEGKASLFNLPRFSCRTGFSCRKTRGEPEGSASSLGNNLFLSGPKQTNKQDKDEFGF